MKSNRAVRLFLIACFSLALLQTAGAGWGFFGDSWFAAGLLVSFTACGVFLLWAGLDQIRVQALGTSFLLVAADYSHGVTADLAISFAPIRFLLALPIEIFLAYTTWYLVGQFPRVSSPRRGLELFRAVILFASASLFLYNVLIMVGVINDTIGISALGDRNFTDLYVYGLTLLSIPFCWHANRYTTSDEKRRVRLFLLGLAVGLGIPCADIVLSVVSSAYAAWALGPFSEQFVTPMILLLVLSVPVTTSYALVVDEVMDLRIVFAKAVRYLLGRWLISLIAAVPFLLLIQYLYELRNESLGAIASDPAVLVLLGCAGLGVWAVQSRKKLLEALDKKFYRSTAATATLLNDLIVSIPASRDIEALCRTTLTRLEAAVFPEYIHFFVLDPGFNRYRNIVDSKVFLEQNSETVSFALDRQQADRRPGPRGPEIVVPLYSLDGWLIGLIVIGPKKSEMAFDDREIALLSTVGTAVALGLESQDIRSSRQKQPGKEGLSQWRGLQTEHPNWLVRVCRNCNNTCLPEQTECCNQTTSIGSLPRVVNGRFRLEARLGSGTTSEVYLAVDLGLDRHVALKVLHDTEVSVEELQKESRTSAALQHPSLASIYDIQWCLGKPVLVFERLVGGTLEKRLQTGPMTVNEVIQLGLHMSDALEYIHRHGIWHHDIKPSNIAYTADSKPKILDFGLARMIRRGRTVESMEINSLSISEEESRHSVTVHGLVGTPLYWSPEIIKGQDSDPSVDVWALCLVLYQALSGSNPAQGSNWFASANRIVKAGFPPLTEQRADCPSSLAEVIARGLDREFSSRLRSAKDLYSALATLPTAGAGSVPDTRLSGS
ncbi:MAG: serine/threonine-protein kinase [Pseudohongiellaceae bacterium]